MHRDRRGPDPFDDGFMRSIAEGIERLVDAGMDPAEALSAAGEAAGSALKESAPALAAELVATSPRMLREHAAIRRRFNRHLHKHWGKALDLYYSILVGAEELGREFDARQSSEGEVDDDVFEILTGIHARAIRVATEVHVLLSRGFPLGALARCRTLHELSVTSAIISTWGRHADFPDLAARFLEHQSIAQVADAEVYQSNAERLGLGPFAEVEMEEWRAERKELLQKYGTEFKKDYGWAIPLFGFAPNFRQLEERAELAHLRGYYKWASHEVHSHSRGLELNIFGEDEGNLYRLTGATLEGFAEPGIMALGSLVQTLTNLVVKGTIDIPSPRDLWGCMAIQVLLDKCGDAFAAADEAVAVTRRRANARANSRFAGRLTEGGTWFRTQAIRISSVMPGRGRPRW